MLIENRQMAGKVVNSPDNVLVAFGATGIAECSASVGASLLLLPGYSTAQETVPAVEVAPETAPAPAPASDQEPDASAGVVPGTGLEPEPEAALHPEKRRPGRPRKITAEEA